MRSRQWQYSPRSAAPRRGIFDFCQRSAVPLRYYRTFFLGFSLKAAKWRPSLFRSNQDFSTNCGNFATLTAILRASSRVSNFAADRRPGFFFEMPYSNVARRHKANNLVQLAVRQATVWRLQ
jgi:hypothetical protein